MWIFTQWNYVLELEMKHNFILLHQIDETTNMDIIAEFCFQ